MDNIEREFSYKVSCVETSCYRTFNLCQVIDVRMVCFLFNVEDSLLDKISLLVINHCFINCFVLEWVLFRDCR